MELYPLVVTGHVFFVIVALGAHGASALAMVAVQREADRVRLAAILDLSVRSFSVASVALAAAILLGIAATVMGNHGGRLWVWVSVGVLVVLMVLMGPLGGTPMNRVRRALGLRFERNGPGADPHHRTAPSERLRDPRGRRLDHPRGMGRATRSDGGGGSCESAGRGRRSRLMVTVRRRAYDLMYRFGAPWEGADRVELRALVGALPRHCGAPVHPSHERSTWVAARAACRSSWRRPASS